MRHFAWTEEEVSALWNLFDKSLTYKQIAQELTAKFGMQITRNAVRNYIRRHPRPPTKPLFEVPGNQQDSIEKFLGGIPSGVLSISDLHAPYTNWELFEHVVSVSDPDLICVVNGDALDQECVSDYARIIEADIDTELRYAVRIFEVLCGRFRKVILNQGNHERRILRFISKLPNGIKVFAANRIDPMKWLEEKFQNLRCNYDWWLKIGQVIFAHPDEFSTVPMRTVQNVCDHFIADGESFQAVVIGHTHKQGQMMYKNKWLAETGHLSVEPTYYKSHLRKDSWQPGYAVIFLDEHGNVNFQRSQCIPLKGVVING